MKEILIADSDKANRQEFQKIFGTTDYHLVFSESGEDVLLRMKLFKPDLIIAGTALAEKNGYELCQAIKEDPDFKSIPFILLLNMFEDLSESDRKRLKPDGVLTKPLQDAQVLRMVDGLLRGAVSDEEEVPGKGMALESFGDMGEERFGSVGFAENEEEEIIELVDVVEEAAEEAETKVSIDDFVTSHPEEEFGRITSIESWERLEEEEQGGAEEGLVLSLEGEAEEAKEAIVPMEQEEPPAKETSAEVDLFEKLELEDIFEKVGKIELPSESGMEAAPGIETRVQVGEEKPFDLAELETALKERVEAGVGVQEPREEKAEVKEFPSEIGVEAKEEELEAEEFPKSLLEGLLKEEILEEAATEERIEEESPKTEALEEEALPGESMEGEKWLEEELLEEEESVEELLEEEPLPVVEEPQKMEEIDLFEGLEGLEAQEEIKEVPAQMPEVGGALAEAVEVPPGAETGVPPSSLMGEQVEALISEKVGAMMQEIIARHIPEMTKDIVKLTIERIERMVREIVPDIAAKMIEEEIRRLEKGEKE